MVALSVPSAPSVNSNVDLSSVTPVTETVLEVTVTEHVAVLEPSVVVTVIVADPAFTAVTLPELSTVAVAASEDFQLTDLLVALSGATVAVSVSDPPSVRLRVVLLIETPETPTVAGTGSSCPQENNERETKTATKAAEKNPNSLFITLLISSLQR